LLPLGPTDFLGNFDNGNKTKTIANLDQKIRRIPSKTVLRLKDTAGFKTVGTVTFINFGKPERVVLELLRSGKEWRIADIVWDSGSLRGLYRRKAAYEGEAVR